LYSRWSPLEPSAHGLFSVLYAIIHIAHDTGLSFATGP
jgi:hypothetical protein